MTSRSIADRIHARLAELAETSSVIPAIPDTAVAYWKEIHLRLGQVIGERAVEALYNRSLRRTRDQYPSLPEGQTRPDGPADFAALGAALASQPNAVALEAHSALLHTFVNHLASLIGAGLVERIFSSIASSTNELAAPDRGRLK